MSTCRRGTQAEERVAGYNWCKAEENDKGQRKAEDDISSQCQQMHVIHLDILFIDYLEVLYGFCRKKSLPKLRVQDVSQPSYRLLTLHFTCSRHEYSYNYRTASADTTSRSQTSFSLNPQQ